MSSTIMQFDRFDPASLRFAAPRQNKMGGQCVNVYVDGTAPQKSVCLQTPPLTIPFDVQENRDVKTQALQSYTVNLSFRGADTDPRTADFLARMRQMDEVLLAAGAANSKEWFGKPCKLEVVNEFHSKIVRDPKQPQYAPTMKVKLPLKDPSNPKCEDPATLIFDKDKQPVDIKYIKKGSVVVMILELIPVWFINKNMYGVSWKAKQIKVLERPGLNTYAFVDDAVVEQDGEAADGETAML